MKTITNESGFLKALTIISKDADKMADDIHSAGLFALQQVNEHGNFQFAVSLINAIGKKHDKARVIRWLVFFGKLANTKDGITYRKRKDIRPENLEAWMEKAGETPYWELTPQVEAPYTVDFLTGLISLYNRHRQAVQLEGAGKEVKESHVSILPEIMAILTNHRSEIKKDVFDNLFITNVT
jgi:hypothetical protein